MASCLLCASLQMTRSMGCFTTKDEAKSHAAQHLLQTKVFDEDCINLDQVIEQCFTNFAALPLMKKTKITKREGRQSLLDLCHAFFEGRISKSSSRVTCQKCGSGIGLYGKNGTRNLRVAIDHASAHLGSDLFECRKCGCAFSSPSAVQHHLKTVHSLRYLSDYFTDKSADFLDEITVSIKECFSDRNGSSPKKAAAISLRNESTVRNKTRGSKLAVKRQLFCYQLLRLVAGDDGKIQCRLPVCSQRIAVKQRSSYQGKRAMEHVRVHLEKPLFRCKVCLKVHSTRNAIQKHLTSAHALTLSKNYECMDDEFHFEIMNMIRKCYGDESESN